MTLRKTIAFAVLAAGLATAGAASAQDAIAARKDGFKAAKEAMGLIKKTLEDSGDLSVVVAQAERLAGIVKKADGLFPAGSDQGDTKAKSDIWKTPADFAAKRQANEAESAKLAQVAATGDKAAVAKQFGAVGASCKACHDSYRAE